MTPPQSERKSPVGSTETLANEDEEYDSEEDSDFDVDAAPAEGAAEEDSSDSEPDVDIGKGGEDVDGEATDRAKKRRRISVEDAPDEGGGVEVIGELDSGDEATIQRGKERKRGKDKKGKGKGKISKKGSGSRRVGGEDEDDREDDDFDDADEDGGGEGGFVRTRGMRMRMQEERKPLAKFDQSTVDVDALWARLNAPTADTRASTGRDTAHEPAADDSNRDNDNDIVMANGTESTTLQNQTRPGEETITIKRKYKFAGDIITEEKVVPKDSAEAKLYLSLNKSTNADNETESKEQQEEQKVSPNLRRPLRKISRFDPNPPGAIKRSWEKQTTADEGGASTTGQGPSDESKGPKLNTVEKSRLDWAAYVDSAGIKDDLNVHSKAKEGYLGRMEFLNRLEDKREEERRNARLKNMG